MYRRIILAVVVLCMVGTTYVQADQTPGQYQEVLKYLGRNGDFKDNVLKINLPRNDLHVTIRGVPTPTAFGFGGWVGMTKGEGNRDVMMGDLVLLQDEVNPVMSALLDHGLEVTALHNHFFWEEPRIFYMHIHGHGAPLDLAQRVKPALDLIGHVVAPSDTTRMATLGETPQSSNLDTARIARIVGHAGEASGAVYKITLGRDDLHILDMGAVVNSRMGLNSWAAFFGTNDSAAVAGDIAMQETELQPVLAALRQHDLQVVAIHHHMTGIHPMIIFLHYWGSGPVDKLATGFRAAMDAIKSVSPPAMTH